MALAVFSTTFVVTRTFRDERSRTLSRALVLRWYDDAAAQARGWFASKPDAALPRAAALPLPPPAKRPPPSASSASSAKPSAGPTATVSIPSAPAEPGAAGLPARGVEARQRVHAAGLQRPSVGPEQPAPRNARREAAGERHADRCRVRSGGLAPPLSNVPHSRREASQPASSRRASSRSPGRPC